MSSLQYRPEVDGLRAISVLAVIFFHAGFESFGGGYIGVDVFFVISGYLITSIIAGELATGRFSIVNFYERRARRILPALMAVIVVCLPFAWLLMSPQQLKSFGQSLVATTLFSSNLFFWQTSGYFDAASELKPMLHTWSLGVEEQYYLLFPLLLMAVNRWRPMVWVVALSLGSYAFGLWMLKTDVTGAFYLAPARAWELLIGSAVALAGRTTGLHLRAGAVASQALSLIGLALVIGSIFHFDEKAQFPSLPLLAPAVGAALVIAFGVQGTVAAWLLSRAPMVRIGLLSYSAYLWHQPVLAFLRLQQIGGLQPHQQWLAIVVSLALGYASWRLVETPFRSKTKFSRRAIFVLSATGSVAVIALGLAANAGKGFPGRMDPSAQAMLSSTGRSPQRESCHTEGVAYLPPARACRYFNESAEWAAFGDSHVVEPAYVLAEHLKSRQQGLLHLSFSGCAPSIRYESERPGCSAWQREALAVLESRPDIHKVLIGFRYTAAVLGGQTNDYPGYQSQPRIEIAGHDPAQSADLVWYSFVEIIDRLRASGKQVYVIAPIPELGAHVDRYIWRYAAAGTNDIVGTSLAYYQGRNSYMLARFARLPWGRDLVRLDPVPALCDTENCFAARDGKALYSDDSHLSLNGARLLIDRNLAVLEGSTDTRLQE